MSDEEVGWGEENEDEEKVKTKRIEEPVEQKTEAQLLIEAKQKKHGEEDEEKLRQIEEQRRIQREKEDEELRRLKEKQAQRKKEREEEDRKLEEQKKMLEEQRKKDEEERKEKIEEEKRRKIEEAERKKAAAMAATSGGRNFVIEKDKGQSTIDKFMDISKAHNEMSLNTGELEALKRKTIGDRLKPLSIEGMDAKALKSKADELWKIIIQIETAKYDLDERSKRQEYDLRELNERQRQSNMKKYLAQGLDAEANHKYPPKVQIISKHERRTDRRTFSDKKGLFDNSKQQEQKELNKPIAKKRDTWIKEKTDTERKRHSYDELDEEDNGHQEAQEESPSKYSSSRHDDAEVEAEEEEE